MSDTESVKATLRAVRARRQFWIEERHRARTARNDQAAGDAQRLIDEYDTFIEILKKMSDEQMLIPYRQARR